MTTAPGVVGFLKSVQVGQPRELYDSRGRSWYSGFRKTVVSGPVELSSSGLAGDGQADLRVHGGPDKAVCVYPASRYPYWEHDLGVGSLPPGAFGENATVDEVTEDDVCIGDIHRIGDAVLQVSQPRGPCWKLARQWSVKDLAVRFQRTGYTGWYLRVVQPGCIEAGQPIILADRVNPGWTVARANEVHYASTADPGEMAALARCPGLGRSWREKLERLSSTGRRPASLGPERSRLFGPDEPAEA